VWSPDGQRLAAAREDNQDRSRIVVMNRDGSGVREITDGTGDVGPAWSPDGEWIAFRRRQPAAPNEEVWLVRPDGSDAHRVLAKIHDAPIAWTSDSRRLTFSDDADDGTTQLFTVNLEGADRAQLTHETGGEHLEAAWSSDGALFVFRSDPDGPRADEPDTSGRASSVLVVASPDGRVGRTLTTPPAGADDYGPSLGPPAG
jgi:Tol biopolymer transport system component